MDKPLDNICNKQETKLTRLESRGFEDLHHENETLKATIQEISELPSDTTVTSNGQKIECMSKGRVKAVIRKAILDWSGS